MQKLGANTIRVYHVDPTEDHKGCMSAFEDAGIYLFVDLDTFDTQINQVRRNVKTSQWLLIIREGLAYLESNST